jgi:hypothetical protein
LLLLVGDQIKRKLRGDPPHVQLADVFHTKGLTRQQFLKWYFVRLSSRFCELQHHSFVCARSAGPKWQSKSSTAVSTSFDRGSSLKTYVFAPWHCHRTLFWALYEFLT